MPLILTMALNTHNKSLYIRHLTRDGGCSNLRKKFRLRVIEQERIGIHLWNCFFIKALNSTSWFLPFLLVPKWCPSGYKVNFLVSQAANVLLVDCCNKLHSSPFSRDRHFVKNASIWSSPIMYLLLLQIQFEHLGYLKRTRINNHTGLLSPRNFAQMNLTNPYWTNFILLFLIEVIWICFEKVEVFCTWWPWIF